MTCCIVGRHPNIADIDRLIRAQQAASRANNATSVPSYSQIAKRFGLARPSLIRHRDECLAVDRGAPSTGSAGRMASDFAALTPAPGDVDRGVSTPDGQGSDSGERAHESDRTGDTRTGSQGGVHGQGGEGVHAGASRDENANDSARGHLSTDVRPASGTDDASDAGKRGADPPSAGDGECGEGEGMPPAYPYRTRAAHVARARERTSQAAHRWDVVGINAIDAAAERITHAIEDSELRDPNSPRAHATYVEEIIEIVDRMEWNNAKTVGQLARTWGKSQMFVLGCYRDACTLMRLARGSPNEDREVSLRLWDKLFHEAMAKGDALSLKVAADARKGYDAASGIVDKSTKLQFNLAQSDEAKLFVSIFLDEARDDPAMLERIRRRMEAVRDKLGDPTALLTTGTVVE